MKHKKLPASLRDYLVLSVYPITMFDQMKLNYPSVRNAFKDLLKMSQEGVPNYFVPFDIGFVADKHALIVVHPWYKNGSLSDMIYGAKPSQSFEYKSNLRSQGNKGTALTEEKVRIYCKQILRFLAYMRSHGIVFSHRK